MTAPVITVDGPSGSGKGTVSLVLARELDWHFLDSGALYRVLALAAQRRGLALDDEPGVSALGRALAVTFPAEQPGQVILDGDDVSLDIRTEKAGNAASRVAALPLVREALLQRQRDFRRAPGLVADGRDMGTVVFPAAEVKIFLTASAEKRAERRYKQLKEKGLDASLSELVQEIAERDRRDSERKVAPLVPADDAVVLDTSDLDISASLDAVRIIVRERLGVSS